MKRSSSKRASKTASKTASKKASKKAISVLSMYDTKTITLKKLENVIDNDKVAKKVYGKLKKKILPEINKLSIETFIIPLPLSDGGMYWTDYAYDYIKEKHKTDILDVKYMYFTFYLNNKATMLNENRPIIVNFSPLNKQNKASIIELFEEHLGDYFNWTGSNNRAIEIKLNL